MRVPHLAEACGAGTPSSRLALAYAYSGRAGTLLCRCGLRHACDPASATCWGRRPPTFFPRAAPATPTARGALQAAAARERSRMPSSSSSSSDEDEDAVGASESTAHAQEKDQEKERKRQRKERKERKV